MTLQLKKSGSYTYLYAIKSFRKEDGRCTTKVVEKFGTVEELREKLGGKDPIEWARARVAEMTASEKEEGQKVVVEYDPQTYIQKGEQRSYNGGYLFLQKIYYELGLDYICKKIAKKHKLLKYDLNGILSMLVYTRILYPGSKRSSLEDAGKFFEQPECTLEQVYRALSLLAEEFNEIQADVYKRSRKLWKRNTQVVYYDLTNYFFECEEEGGLVQFGHCKEGRPLPVVQMGLFMDHDGFPLAMCIEPGNKAETSTLKAYGADTQGQVRPVEAGGVHRRRAVFIREPQERQRRRQVIRYSAIPQETQGISSGMGTGLQGVAHGRL